MKGLSLYVSCCQLCALGKAQLLVPVATNTAPPPHTHTTTHLATLLVGPGGLSSFSAAVYPDCAISADVVRSLWVLVRGVTLMWG